MTVVYRQSPYPVNCSLEIWINLVVLLKFRFDFYWINEGCFWRHGDVLIRAFIWDDQICQLIFPE